MDELDNLLDHLDISKEFSILGHSWGAMLGAWYAGTRQPSGLRKLVLANGPARTKDWRQANEMFLKSFPEEVKKALDDYELDPLIPTREYQDAIGLHRAGKDSEVDEKYRAAVKKYDAYRDALMVFFTKHTCRKVPLPDPLVQSMTDMGPYPNVNEKFFII